MIIDATNQIVGRIASFAAKKALLGETVSIINCEKAIITGNRKNILSEFKRKRNLGTFKGPYYSRLPDRLVRRIIRGMLPYKQPKGKNAFKKIRCYNGIPKEFENRKAEQIQKTGIDKLSNFNYVQIKEVCRHLGEKQ